VVKLKTVTKPDLDHWFDAFNLPHELTLTFTCPKLPDPWEAKAADYDAEKLQQFLTDCELLSATSVLVHVRHLEGLFRVRPRYGSGRWPAPSRPWFSTRLAGSPRSSPSPRNGFSKRDSSGVTATGSPRSRLLILVADEPGRLDGPFLTVLGSNHHAEIDAALGSAPSFEHLQADWEVDAGAVLPRGRAAGADADISRAHRSRSLADCQRAIARLRNRLVVSALANRTFRNETEDSWIAVFTGARAVEVPLDSIDGGLPRCPQAEPRAASPLQLGVRAPEAAETRIEIGRRVVASVLLPKYRQELRAAHRPERSNPVPTPRCSSACSSKATSSPASSVSRSSEEGCARLRPGRGRAASRPWARR